MNDLLIDCKQLNKTFKSEAENLEIIKNLDLSVRKREQISITGPSGCGKSTLLSILGGLDRPSSGMLKVAGLDLVHADEKLLAKYRAATVGFVFQFHYLLKDFSALENTMLPAFMLSGKKSEAESKAKELLNAVGLSDRLNHLPAKLSGGERQRVALARALINRPAIILADEPTGNLDRQSAMMVEKLLFDMADSLNTTLILVTHDTNLAARAGTRFVLTDGSLVLE
ncbi:ABC transporter ATP-binding protein [Spirochaetota bacterium]